MHNQIHTTQKEKILTDDRATGQLHIGHLRVHFSKGLLYSISTNRPS